MKKKVRHLCNECEFKTFHKFLLKRHQIKIHNAFFEEEKQNAKKNRCKFCNVFALSTNEIATHMTMEHPEERLFKCDECTYRSNWMNNITMHKNGKHQLTKLFCNQCNYECVWTNELSRHDRTVHGTFKNKYTPRDTLSDDRLCDSCGFQTNKSHSMKKHKRKCKALNMGGLSVQIGDVRTEISSLKKIPCKERSDKEKIKLQRLQQKLCNLKIKLRPPFFQKSERRGRRKLIISLKPVDGRKTEESESEESDASRILCEVEKHQEYMSFKYNTSKLAQNDLFGITTLPIDVTSEIPNEVGNQQIGLLTGDRADKSLEAGESMTVIKEEKGNELNLLEYEDANTMKKTYIPSDDIAEISKEIEKQEINLSQENKWINPLRLKSQSQ